MKRIAPPDWRVQVVQWSSDPWQKGTRFIKVGLTKKGEFSANCFQCEFFLMPVPYTPQQEMLEHTGGAVFQTKSFQVYVWVWPLKYGWTTFLDDIKVTVCEWETSKGRVGSGLKKGRVGSGLKIQDLPSD